MFMGKGRAADFERVANNTAYARPPLSGHGISRKLQHGAAICETGLAIPDGLEIEQWEKIGRQLCKLNTATQWAIGDWWAYGHQAYGKRKAFAVVKALPYEFGSLMNLGSVARSVQPSFRNEVLSFTHHVAVASLDPADQKKWLTRAENLNWSVSKLRGAIHEWRERQAMDCPGFAPLSEAKRWLYNLLRRARDSEKMCTWPYGLDTQHMDLLQDHYLEELVEAASAAAGAWNDLVKELGQYLQKRAAAGVTVPELPEDQEPD
ncbi:hypothetical protein [Bradyrhizobium liaoningense]